MYISESGVIMDRKFSKLELYGRTFGSGKFVESRQGSGKWYVKFADEKDGLSAKTLMEEMATERISLTIIPDGTNGVREYGVDGGGLYFLF